MIGDEREGRSDVIVSIKYETMFSAERVGGRGIKGGLRRFGKVWKSYYGQWESELIRELW